MHSASVGSDWWLKRLPRPVQTRLAGRNDLIAVVENTAWLVFDKACRIVFGLLVGAWVARYLGPERFGELAYVLVYLGLFQVAASMGVDGIAVRELSRDRSNAPAILGSAFAIKLTAGLALLLAAVAGMAAVNGFGDQRVWLCMLAGGSMVFQAGDTIDLWFQSQSQSRRTVVAKMTAYVISNGLRVALIICHAPLAAFAAVVAFESLLASGALVWVYRLQRGPRPWAVIMSQVRSLLGEGWPMALSGISIAVYMRVDQLLIKALLGEKELGIYAAVLPLATVWQFIPMTLSVSLAPFVARKKAESEAAYWQALEKVFRVFAAIGWLVSVPTALIAPLLVGVLFGPAFESGAHVLSIYVFTNVLINVGVAQGLWVVNEKRSNVLLLKTLVGAVVAFLCNLILIPRLGLSGVAISALLAQLTAVILTNVFLSRRILWLQIRSLTMLPSQSPTPA
jgi:O-antigen/teichoic acid export membrane protein